MSKLVQYKLPKQIYLFFSIGLLLVACGRNKKVDVSNINVNITVQRFDADFDQMHLKPMNTQAAFLKKKYGAFYQDYIERILEAGSTLDTAYFAAKIKDYMVFRSTIGWKPPHG